MPNDKMDDLLAVLEMMLGKPRTDPESGFRSIADVVDEILAMQRYLVQSHMMIPRRPLSRRMLAAMIDATESDESPIWLQHSEDGRRAGQIRLCTLADLKIMAHHMLAQMWPPETDGERREAAAADVTRREAFQEVLIKVRRNTLDRVRQQIVERGLEGSADHPILLLIEGMLENPLPHYDLPDDL